VNTWDGESSAGIIDPFSVYEGLLLPESPSTSDGNRVWLPKCLAKSWSSEMLLRETEPLIGAAESRLASARCPPETPGCDVPETTVI
jgi:hypothetical protein